MKKLFLTCMFVFATAFTFAGVESNETVAELEVVRTCVPATLSCGLSGWACGDSTMEIIENALAADEAFC